MRDRSHELNDVPDGDAGSHFKFNSLTVPDLMDAVPVRIKDKFRVAYAQHGRREQWRFTKVGGGAIDFVPGLG